jgi:hypothetical protein
MIPLNSFLDLLEDEKQFIVDVLFTALDKIV